MVMSTCKMCQVNELVLYLLKAKVVCGDMSTCKMCQQSKRANELVLYLLKAKVVCGDVDL